MKRQTSKRQLNREYEAFVMHELYQKWIVMINAKYIPKVQESNSIVSLENEVLSVER
jgi:hypothetical protein